MRRKNRHRSCIFPASNMIVRWITSKVSFGVLPPINGVRKHSSPYISMASVHLYVFTLSRRKLLKSGVSGRNIRFSSLRTCVHNFPSSFLIATTVCFIIFTRPLRSTVCFIGVCIYQFSFNFLWVVQLRYIYYGNDL